ncbi:acyltransferase family protein [Uliginosibacterium sp. sgz301328]|uniref:acyltransferase family protein n=1 Tax=Uliginosibacterium sp. sgz301328 TaxID=3243764 RepID=UPI00359D27BC
MKPSRRLPLIDAIKAIASQLIVLHHLAFYGPMSDVAYPLAPELISWMSRNGRMAVQAFLVVGGFLAVRSLAPGGRLASALSPGALLKHRYLRLALPYAAMLILSIVSAAIARHWADLESIPAAPTVMQMIAHVFLLNGILGVDSLSAGVWYVAIDFQLFAVLLGCLWLAGTRKTEGARLIAGPLIVAGVGLASLFFFNRDSDWDDWAVYFFGAYALGALAYWAAHARRAHGWMLAMAAVTGIALYVDFRERIAVAGVVALALALAEWRGGLERWPSSKALAFLGRISYSVFLVHFPVCLLINAFFDRFMPEDPVINLMGIAVAWAASVACGTLFYRAVESRAGEWLAMARDGLQRFSRAP